MARNWKNHRDRMAATSILSFAAVLAIASVGYARDANANEPGCSGTLADLQAAVAERQELLNQSCEPVVTRMSSFLAAKGQYGRQLRKTSDTQRRAAIRIYQDDIRPFTEMVEKHEELRRKAKSQGVLLNERQKAAFAAVKAGTYDDAVFFGIPIEAMSDDEQVIAEMKKVKADHDKNYLAMEAFKREHAPRLNAFAERSNVRLAKERDQLKNLAGPYFRQEDGLRQIFFSGKFAHCLGTPLLEGGPQSITLEQKAAEGAQIGRDGAFKLEDPAEEAGVSFKSLPGVEPRLMTLVEARKLLRDLPVPTRAIKLPEELQFVRDGVTIPKLFAETQRRSNEAERALVVAEVAEGAAGFLVTAVEYTADLGVTIASGTFNAVADPLVENFSVQGVGFFEALANAGADFVINETSATFQAFERVVNDFADALAPGGRLIQVANDPRGEVKPNSAFRFLGNFVRGFSGVARSVLPLGEDFVPPLGDGATLADARKNFFAVQTEKERLENVREAGRESLVALKDLEAKALDALAVFSAGRGLGSAGRVAVSVRKSLQFASRRAQNAKIVSKIRAETARLEGQRSLLIEQAKKSPDPKIQELTRKLQDDIDFFNGQLPRFKPAPSPQLVRLEKLRASGQNDAVKLAENRFNDALAELGEQARKSVNAQRPFKVTETAKAPNGQSVELGEFIGKGGVKQVFDAPDPAAVIQKFTNTNLGTVTTRQAIDAEIEAARRLKEAGIKTTEDLPFRDKDGNILRDADGNPVFELDQGNNVILRQTERIDNSLEVQNIVKDRPDGRLTKEEFAAVAEAAHKANNKGFVLMDLKDENVAITFDQLGRRQANVFDKGGVIDVNQIIAARRADDSLIRKHNGETASVIEFFGEKFDLASSEGVRKLQSLVLDGREVCCPNMKKLFDPAKNRLAVGDIVQRLTTPDFAAGFSGSGKFKDLVPLDNGKPTSFLDTEPGTAANLLDEAADQRLKNKALKGVTDPAQRAKIEQGINLINEGSGAVAKATAQAAALNKRFRKLDENSKALEKALAAAEETLSDGGDAVGVVSLNEENRREESQRRRGRAAAALADAPPPELREGVGLDGQGGADDRADEFDFFNRNAERVEQGVDAAQAALENEDGLPGNGFPSGR